MKCLSRKRRASSKRKAVKYATVIEELSGNFKPRKEESLKLAQSFKRLNNGYYHKVKACGTLIDFNSSKKLVNANFCKNRLCPMCNWRRSMKLGCNVSKIVEHLENDYRFIFLTLTVPNVKADKLDDTINKLQTGFTNLINHNVNIRKSFKGYFRALEITFNKKTHTYHPHFHVIVAVKPDYFDKSNKYYVTHEYLLEKWRHVMNDQSINQVWIQVCRDKYTGSSTINMKSAIVEVAKYTVKTNDYLFKSYKLTDEVVSTLSTVLLNRRLVTMGGIFRKTAQLLGLCDKKGELKDDELVHIDDESASDSDETIYRYVWRNDNYILFRVFMPDGIIIDATTGEVIDDSGG